MSECSKSLALALLARTQQRNNIGYCGLVIFGSSFARYGEYEGGTTLIEIYGSKEVQTYCIENKESWRKKLGSGLRRTVRFHIEPLFHCQRLEGYFVVEAKDSGKFDGGDLGLLALCLVNCRCHAVVVERLIGGLSFEEGEAGILQNINHEVRTPLNAVVGMAELLSLEVDSHERMEMVQIIKDSSKRLVDVVELLLSFFESHRKV